MSKEEGPELGEFLNAMIASGSRPSPALIKAIASLSGKDVADVEAMICDASSPPEKKFKPETRTPLTE